MSQTDGFHIPNLAGAPFRNLLNQILAALSDQNAGSTEPANPFAGMVWLDTSTSNPIFKLRNAANTGWVKIFTAEHPPTKAQVGLGNVPNYSATSSLSDGSASKLLLAVAGKTLQDNKLDKTGQAYDSARLGNKLANQFVQITGTYPNLRAQATTKADVGLGNVQNYGITSSLTSNNGSQYLSAKGGYDLNQMKVNKTTTVNGKPLSTSITLTAANVGALPASGGNLGGPLNYTPDTGDILKVDGKVILRRISAAGGLSFGGDDALIIGSGEARQTLQSNVSATAEVLHLGSDNEVEIYTNLQAGWGSGKKSTFETDGGFKPHNAAKTRANLSVYAKSETYNRNETYSRTQAYSRNEVDGKIPITGYRKISLSTINRNTGYTISNPFGSAKVFVYAEINVSGKWLGQWWTSRSGYTYGFWPLTNGSEIYLRTGSHYLSSGKTNFFTPHCGYTNATSDVASAACCIHVWRLGV